MENVLLIVNPRAGRGFVEKNLLDIVNAFSAKGVFVNVYVTQSKSDAFRAAKREAGHYDVIACSGGDGTLDEVVSGIAKSGYRPRVGYIPAGSTNDFANSLQLPSDMKRAAEIIVDEYSFACDIGTIEDWYFVYVAAFGAFTEVSYKTNQDMKNLLGHMAYILEGARSIPSIKPYHMKFTLDDEQVIEGDFLYGMVTNSESVGGFKNIMGNDIELNDGLFELVLVRNPVTPLDWEPILSGLVSHQGDNKFIYFLKANKVDVETEEEVAWTVDGEDGGIHKNVTIQNHSKFIEIMVDRNIYEKYINGEPS